MGRYAEAITAYRQALALRPDYADAWNNLGVVYDHLERYDEAVDCHRKVLALDPGNIHAHCNLCNVYRMQGRLDEANAHGERAVQLKPDFVDALINLAAIRGEQGRYDAALELYEKALAIDPSSADANLSHGMLCLAMGDFQRGWRGYQWRPTRLRALSSRITLDEKLPEDLAGRTVALIGEQGLGDELFFLRFAQELKHRGARLVYQCEPKLRGMIERTGVFDQLVAQDESLPRCDLQYLAGDLPRMFVGDARSSHTPGALPLSALDARLASMRERLARAGPPPYLGLTWRAGTPPTEQIGRLDRALYKEVPLDVLAGTLEGISGTVLALQRKPRPGEIDTLRHRLTRDVCDMSDANDDLEDMLALLVLVDEYVGVSNTNMHLMAGVGKAGRVLVPHPPEWRWMLTGDAVPWFPGFVLYRQGVGREWAPVLARLADDLRRSLAL